MNDLKDVLEFATVMGVIAVFVLVVTGGIVFLVRAARRGAPADRFPKRKRPGGFPPGLRFGSFRCLSAQKPLFRRSVAP